MIRQLALCGLLIAACAAQAQNRPPDDLPAIARLMVRAAESLRYSGTLQVIHREGPRRVVSKEYMLRDGRKSRTWFPKDSPSYGEVIVEDGKTRRHYQPNANRIIVTPIEENAGRRRLLGLLRGKKFEVQDGGQVANRATQLIIVKEPNGRVRQRMWVDTSNGMVLKRELLDNVGSREGYFEFLEVDLNPRIEPGDFQIRRADAKEVTLYDLVRELASNLHLTPVFVPAGYAGLQLSSARIVDSQEGRILHQTYNSPHGMISLFQTSGSFPRRLADNRFRMKQWQAGNSSFLLLGPAPEPVLQDIAQKLGAR